jgi:hypothetical protein
MDEPESKEPVEGPETTVFGLECGATTDDLGVPLDAVVILKHYHEGELGYHIYSTEGLLTVECLGMVRWAQLLIEDGVTLISETGGDENDDDE